MEAKHRLFRWLLAFPTFVGGLSFMAWTVHKLPDMYLLDLPVFAILVSGTVSFAVYAIYADNNCWSDWEKNIR